MYYNYQTQKTLFDHISETQRGERMKDANAAITLLEKWPEKSRLWKGFETWIFPGHFSSSVMAAFASFILSLFNCFCWLSITMEFIYLSQVLHPLKGPNPETTTLYACSFDSSAGTPLHWQCKGLGFKSRSKPKFFQVIFPVVLWLHSHLSFFQTSVLFTSALRNWW